MRRNLSLEKWRQGKQTVGAWITLDSLYTAEALSHMEFDWVCVDLQHGLLDYSNLTGLLPAISTGSATPLVRVAGNEPHQITKALDAGAGGVIVPMVNTKAQAERAVAACRYPPDGDRSFGPMRAALYGGNDYWPEANREVACIVMIETKMGLENLESIASTRGVDGIFVGPADLSLALGLPPLTDNPDALHEQTVDRIIAACAENDIAFGILTSSVEFSRKYFEKGANFVALGVDIHFMLRAATSDLAALRTSST